MRSTIKQMLEKLPKCDRRNGKNILRKIIWFDISSKIGSLDLQGCSLNEELREQKNLIDDFKKRIELIGTKHIIYRDIQIKNIQSSNILSRNIPIGHHRLYI